MVMDWQFKNQERNVYASPARAGCRGHAEITEIALPPATAQATDSEEWWHVDSW